MTQANSCLLGKAPTNFVTPETDGRVAIALVQQATARTTSAQDDARSTAAAVWEGPG